MSFIVGCFYPAGSCVAGDVEIREMTTLMSDPNRLLLDVSIDQVKRGIVSSDAANIQMKRL